MQRLHRSVRYSGIVPWKTSNIRTHNLYVIRYTLYAWQILTGITISNSLSVCEHVNNTIASCAQSVHALRILRSHGLLDDSIYVIYRAVVIAKLTYASSAWWGFTTAEDRQRLEAVIRRGIRSRLCNPDQTTLAEMIEQADDVLFSQALKNNHHVLHTLLPNKLEITYQLRHRLGVII